MSFNLFITDSCSLIQSLSNFCIVHNFGSQSAVAGDGLFSSGDMFTSSLSLFFIGQHSRNHDSSFRTTLHCVTRCCSFSSHCCIPSWGGKQILYSLALSERDWISWKLLNNFLKYRTKGKESNSNSEAKTKKIHKQVMFANPAVRQMTKKVPDGNVAQSVYSIEYCKGLKAWKVPEDNPLFSNGCEGAPLLHKDL